MYRYSLPLDTDRYSEQVEVTDKIAAVMWKQVEFIFPGYMCGKLGPQCGQGDRSWDPEGQSLKGGPEVSRGVLGSEFSQTGSGDVTSPCHTCSCHCGTICHELV